MKLTISCSRGAIRHIYLANSLDKKGYLQEIFVPYDARKFPYKLLKKREDITIDPRKVRTNFLHTVMLELIGDYGPLVSLFHPSNRYLLGEIADRYVAYRLKAGVDFVIAESNMALHTIRKSKKIGAISVVDRTNSHIEFQVKLLREEYKKFGQKFAIDKRVIEKNVQEYKETDYIFVLSSFVKESFLKKGIPEHKLVLVPSGIDIKRFKPLKKRDKIFRIIFCGGLNLKKGVQYLLQAYSELQLKNSELVLIGPVSTSIESILAEYRGYYTHIGWVPRNLLYRYFSQGSVFVLPSIEEGLAKVIMEAMACGLPVIATTNTGAADIIRNGKEGFVIPIRNIRALKEKIIYFYENPQMGKKMGENARKRIESNFTLEHYVQRVVKACERILKGR